MKSPKKTAPSRMTPAKTGRPARPAAPHRAKSLTASPPPPVAEAAAPAASPARSGAGTTASLRKQPPPSATKPAVVRRRPVAKPATKARAAVSATKKSPAVVPPAAAPMVVTPVPAPAPHHPRPHHPAPHPVPPVGIPPILLEGDDTVPLLPSGPGKRFVLGPKVPPPAGGVSSALPGAYGTRRLFLAARDPHWLFAHWDLNEDEAQLYRSFAREGRLALQVYREAVGGEPFQRIALPVEARSWFIRVGRASTRFAAELGYEDTAGQWQMVAAAAPVVTPPETISEARPEEFATIPVDVPFGQILAKVEEIAAESAQAAGPAAPTAVVALEPVSPTQPAVERPVAAQPPGPFLAPGKPAPALVEVIAHLREAGFTDLPLLTPPPETAWTPAQERALAAVTRLDETRRVWVGSLDLTEMVRERLGISSAAWAGPAQRAGQPTPAGISSGAVPTPPPAARSFWFNVNAELVIYGATEPDATLTVAGRTVKLRPDGTFSLRFALPDGDYGLTAEAVSAAGDDARGAALEFSRRTAYRGDVGATPADPALKSPRAEHIA